MNEVEYRAASVAAVDYPGRTVEVIVTPWEQEAEVDYKGRTVREVFSRGAFDGIERRPNRIRVNRDHDHTRWVGRAIALHPSREEGLVAELRIAKTELGDETLALADDGILDASAEFAVMPGGETWTGRLRRITKAWLGGVAFTGTPAYPGANVLSVRAQETAGREPGTPNRERLELARFEAEAARLDAVYALTQH